MSYLINNGWFLFCILFGLLLLLTFILKLQSGHFYTKDVVIRKFNILDLELASSPREIVNIIHGIYELPQSQLKKTLNALKGQLYIHFLFMPCAYGCVYLLCIKVAERIHFLPLRQAFMALAWLQIVSWIFDIIKNVYLLREIHPDPVMPNQLVHKTYLEMEAVKWGILLTGAVFSASAICYFWLAGHYSPNSLPYILIVSAELIFFLAVHIFFPGKKRLNENF